MLKAVCKSTKKCVEICRWSHKQVLRAPELKLAPSELQECSFNFTWQHYGNRFKHNPVSSFARVASFYFSLKRRTRQTAAGYQVLRWQEVLLTRQEQNKAPVALDSIHGAGE